MILAPTSDQNQIESQEKTKPNFPLIFRLILELFGLLLDRLWVAFWLPLAGFGLHWGSPWPPLAPILDLQDAIPSLFSAMDSFGRYFPSPWAAFGPHFGFLWLLLGSLGTLFDPTWPSFWASNFRINRLILARLSPDECWRVPAESKRILRNRLVIIEVHRHLIFLKVSNRRLPQHAESKKQGGRRCVARWASSIVHDRI